MREIKLQRSTWEFDDQRPIAEPGGFGTVYRGYSAEGRVVAIKRLHVDARAAAHRELSIAEVLVGRNLPHVIPVYDAGLDANSDDYFLAMELAEQSLRQRINAQDLGATVERLQILIDIADGILETSGIVHRDLKPENVLFSGGTWKICDFGIARFVEAATSANTVQAHLSKEYAAPEQWKGDPPSKKTDVYALGCIAYELFAGGPPFQGPSREDFQSQHLYETPSLAIEAPPRALSAIGHMLRKPPDARPEVQRIRQQFVISKDEQSGQVQVMPGLQKLRAAADQENRRRIEEQVAAARAAAENVRLRALADHALESIVSIRERLLNKIIDVYPDAAQFVTPKHIQSVTIAERSIRMEKASIHFGLAHYYSEEALNPRGYLLAASGWKCLASAEISAARPGHELGATLLFCDAGPEKTFRWYEFGFRDRIVANTAESTKQFGLPLHHLDGAIAGTSIVYELCDGPTAIDDEDIDTFCDRWAGLFADALMGVLVSPSDLARKLAREG